MKFSDIKEQDWLHLQAYYDTCLLPITALTGGEAPWQMTMELEKLRDAIDLIEAPFKGRIVTIPVIQYSSDPLDYFNSYVASITEQLKKNGFKYVFAVSMNEQLRDVQLKGVDHLFIAPKKDEITPLIAQLWHS